MALDGVRILVKHVCGYEIPEQDDVLLSYMYASKCEYVASECGLKTVPQGAENIVDELTTSEYLMALDKSKVLGEDVVIVSKLREGDTDITFGGGSSLERLQEVIAYLGRKRDLSCYRRMRW